MLRAMTKRIYAPVGSEEEEMTVSLGALRFRGGTDSGVDLRGEDKLELEYRWVGVLATGE